MAKVSGYDRKLLLVWNGIPFAAADQVRAHFRALESCELDAVFFFESGKDQVSLVLDSGVSLQTASPNLFDRAD
jgi:hypothetical protein